jgi:hypothetical protein
VRESLNKKEIITIFVEIEAEYTMSRNSKNE